MRVLVIDVGGTHVKILATGEKAHREFVSGPTLTARQMVSRVKRLAAGWKYDRVSIGYPGPVLHHRPMREPHNLGRGWMGFDFARAFRRPTKVVNDAAMQALGGSSLIVDGLVEPMELGHLPYRKRTFEDYVGIRGFERLGKRKWRRAVFDVVERLVAALEPDEVVLGGGTVKRLKRLPPGCREGDNANAFKGGFRMWERTRRTEGRKAKGARG
jgi:polyphosphate glucokinase